MRHHREGPFWLHPNNGIIYNEDDPELNEYGETDEERKAAGLMKFFQDIPYYRDFFNVHVLPDGVKINDPSYLELQEDGNYLQRWIVKPKDFAYAKYNLEQRPISAVRWEHEQASVPISGIPNLTEIAPNDYTRGRINDLITAVVSAEKTGQTITEVDYKTDSGKFIKLSVEQLYSLARQISDYIEQGFTREKEVTEALKTATTLEELAATTTTLADW